MQEQNKTAAQMIEALRDDMYEKYGMGWDGFEFGQIQGLMEQYAAQQVQEITDVGQSGQYWGDQWVKMRERAERAEKQLTEVTRQRDELKEKVLDILPRLAEGCRESYYFRGIKEIDQAHCLIEELENEKKDELPR